ncbi:DUF551 domain-containing protein [Salmonella enterica]|nr:DUF551 domain-containing protein [Salmonella enterica]EBS3998918.1 hypothetical protein [Salmonella enterica subsp. enterica serovar Matopeni]ECC2957250.1 DUF551 domain-containing protein [Salmonella enterica subsp. enterica]EBR7228628.1 DUF551 domain-containing protein [Salmonella enterica]EDT6417027.1 DUF551 domain-containing protein [Salmonella enterica subsp. enterica]
MKENQITASMAKDIAFKLGAVLNDEEAEIFADGYNAALLKVNKNASTELPNYANLSTSSQAAPDDSGLLPCPFCGSPAEHYPDGDMEGYIIMCGNKNGDCNLQAFGFTTPEEAEKAWNTRAAMLHGAEPVSQTYKLNELSGNSPVTPDGWISCSERMPDREYVLAGDFSGTHYLASIPNVQVGIYADWFDDEKHCWDDGDGNDLHLKEVTHWMPLPEPPQEVK